MNNTTDDIKLGYYVNKYYTIQIRKITPKCVYVSYNNKDYNFRSKIYINKINNDKFIYFNLDCVKQATFHFKDAIYFKNKPTEEDIEEKIGVEGEIILI